MRVEESLPQIPEPTTEGTDAPTEQPEVSAVEGDSPAKPTQSPNQEPGMVESPVVLAQGAFITHEHSTTGSVKILKYADGSRTLRIENLITSDGPKLEVWLTDAPVIEGIDGWRVFDDGKFISLGALKGNLGSQNYAIPLSVKLDDFSSVSIWCERFSVSFGAAALSNR